MTHFDSSQFKKKVSRKIKIYIKLNENDNATYQNL